jgi:hypothetical protein
MPYQQRLECLDHARPLVINCAQSLTLPLLAAPLNLNETEKKVVLVAQALLKHLARAYARAALDASNHSKAPKLTVAKCFHRAITTIGLQIKVSYQLYTPPSQSWNFLHSLFQLAAEADLNNIKITDPALDEFTGTNKHAYTVSAALACARPLQLRSSEIAALYKLLPKWTEHIEVSSYDTQGAGIYAAAPQEDREPDYADTFSSESLESRGLAFDFQNLLGNLDKGEIGGELTSSLKQHLKTHWGSRISRKYERKVKPASEQLDVIVGLTAIHHHLIKGVLFDDFVLGYDEDKLVMDDASSWQERRRDHDKDPQNAIYSLNLKDESKNGFKLQADAELVPMRLQSGELIGFREPSRRRWQLAVVRWVKRTDKLGVLVGLEKLAAQLDPWGASTITSAGRDSEFMRVLLVGQGEQQSLVMPHMPFSEQFPIMLKKRGEQRKINLSRRITSTGSFLQYRFRNG